MCGDEENGVLVTPGCRDEDGKLISWKVCRNCDYGINEHTEGECTCD
jgi:hypothetical protein